MRKTRTARRSSPKLPKARTETADSQTAIARQRFCSLRQPPRRAFAPHVAGERLRLLLMNQEKWVNRTLLTFAFFENAEQFTKWAGSDALKAQTRKAFKRWTDLGIGLRFKEIADRASADVRIGFEDGDGH